MTAKEIRIYPAGWEASPNEEKFSISLLGHLMPKIYVCMAEVFEFRADVDAEATQESIVAGLEFALTQYPILSGVLRADSDNGDLWVEKKRDSAVSLHVKDMASGNDFPSYDELDEKDFPANMIVANKVLPESVTDNQWHSPLGNNDGEGIPMTAFQISFIRGGLILAVAVHHCLSDGPGCDGFLATWAENSTAAARRLPFIPVKERFDIKGSYLDVSKPNVSEAEQLSKLHPVLKDAGAPMTPLPADFKMPVIVCQMFHFSKSKAEKLKLQASNQSKNEWISTYDAMMALMWSSVTRARLDFLKPNLQDQARLFHAIDTRKVWDPPLPKGFLGVGAFAQHCEMPTITEAMKSDQLSTMAARIRTSIKTLNPDYLTGALRWIAGREDKRYLSFDMKCFLGPDFAGTSWASMQPYEKHDFGFGLPKALRWPSPSFDGVAFLYPSRAAQKPVEADEGFEICLCLEKSCMQRLIEDKNFLEFASPRG